MFKWFGQQFGKSNLKTRQLQQDELNDDSVVHDSAPQQATSDTLSQKEMAEAEKIATNIKMRAQVEADAETTRIITQAKLEAEEILARAEMDAQKHEEDILSAANKEAEIIEVEAKQKALQFLTRVWQEVEKVEKEVEEVKKEAFKEKVEDPLAGLGPQGLYSGEVELAIHSPAEPRLVSILYNYLETISELRILSTRGSWDQGTTIMVVLDKPIPLISILSETPGMAVTTELLVKGGTERVGVPMRKQEEKVTRMKLILKEA